MSFYLINDYNDETISIFSIDQQIDEFDYNSVEFSKY